MTSGGVNVIGDAQRTEINDAIFNLISSGSDVSFDGVGFDDVHQSGGAFATQLTQTNWLSAAGVADVIAELAQAAKDQEEQNAFPRIEGPLIIDVTITSNDGPMAQIRRTFRPRYP